MANYSLNSFSESRLTTQQKRKIDTDVRHNQNSIYLFVKKSKSKLRKKGFICLFTWNMCFGYSKPVSAMGLPIPPNSVVMAQPRVDHSLENSRRLGHLQFNRNDLISKNFFQSNPQFLLMLYGVNPEMFSYPIVIDIIKRLRGGDWGKWQLVGWMILLTYLQLTYGFPTDHLSMNNADFNVGWNRSIRPSHLKKYMGCHSGIKMSGHSYKQNETPGGPQAQIKEFLREDGSVDLDKAYEEMWRRAESSGCEDFSCDYQRFKSLATEMDNPTESSVTEAITILQGEMQHLYKNAERVNYGQGVRGLDFKVTGLGEHRGITHVEIKNPVGSDIQKSQSGNLCPDLYSEGYKLVHRIEKQASKWADPVWRKENIKNLDPNAYVPENSINVLGIIDEFDVPVHEKPTITHAIQESASKRPHVNIVTLNDNRNI